MNERRKAIQRRILELEAGNDECQKCNGLCCRGGYDHFTALDYLIRMFSDNPLDGYGRIQKPEAIRSILLRQLRRISRAPTGTVVPDTKCPNLTPDGCEFQPEDRPIRCVLWTCRALRQSLPSNKLTEIGKLTKELSDVSVGVIEIFRET
ncbi:MAG: hypothetical protein V2A71_00710 [Candidatus Eisenbacteria bacterium]